jgi:Flp pilus assembly protein TadB
MEDEMLLALSLLSGLGVFLTFYAITIPPKIKLVRLEKKGFMERLEERLQAAEMPISAKEFILVSGGIALITFILAFILWAPAIAFAGLILAPILVYERYRSQRDRFRMEYDSSLAECVQLLREGFAATGSMKDAFEHVSRNGPDPAAADFRDAWASYLTGKDLEEAFAPILDRRRNPFLRMVAEVLTLKVKEGGNIGEVLSGLEVMLREQVGILREIRAKQAQARLESTIVSLAPIAFFLAMKLLPWLREYEGGFYRTLTGQFVLVGAILFSTLSYFLSQKIATRGLILEVQE